ncbi:ubiquitin fusion degradation protein [Actinomortierella ambigua]|nr:ubiquitin fusion degradation protein [Actinomortierella ambigua]
MFNGYDDEYNPYGGFHSGGRGGTFNEQYRCYSVAMMQGNERQNVNYGGKIILPQSALAKLASLHIQYPMLFELSRGSQKTHAGVLEFIAEEGRVYLPHWMMKTIGLEEGGLVTVKSTSLSLGRFVKIQPQSVDFLDISDPKAVLENALRNFSTLTQGDKIEILYNDKVYAIEVLEIKPTTSAGVSIVETDLEVDFAPPVGYQEPTPTPKPRPLLESKMRREVEERTSTPDSTKQSPFDGQGQRLGGARASTSKSTKVASSASSTTSVSTGTASTKPVDILDQDGSEAPPALNLPLGTLYFGYKYIPPKTKEDLEREAQKQKEHVFEGTGQTLRPPRRNAARGSGANSPAPSVSSVTSASSNAARPSTPSVPSKPDTTPFQGKGHTMR